MKDEYLFVSQAAYLLNCTKHRLEQLISFKKINCIVRQGRRLIHVSELEQFVSEKMKKYDLARTYFIAENKSSFWKLQQKKFNNIGLCHDDSMIEYLTISQVAYLLNVSRQAVHGLIERGRLKERYTELPGRAKFIIYIRADDVERYVKEYDSSFKRALEFLESEDSFDFWKNHESDFEENWYKANKEMRKKYYGKKKI